MQALHGIQSGAKQWHKMLAEDDDPNTNFPLNGYLIGGALDASRDDLIQNAEALIGKVKADKLPGYDDPAACSKTRSSSSPVSLAAHLMRRSTTDATTTTPATPPGSPEPA